MKKLLLFTTLSFLMFSSNSQNSKTEIMEQKLPTIGIEFSQFASEFPDIVKGETDGNKQYNINDTIQSLDGTWAYQFEKNTLKWFMFNSYSDDISQEDFDTYLSATKQIIDEYKAKYGEPTEF